MSLNFGSQQALRCERCNRRANPEKPDGQFKAELLTPTLCKTACGSFAITSFQAYQPTQHLVCTYEQDLVLSFAAATTAAFPRVAGVTGGFDLHANCLATTTPQFSEHQDQDKHQRCLRLRQRGLCLSISIVNLQVVAKLRPWNHVGFSSAIV